MIGGSRRGPPIRENDVQAWGSAWTEIGVTVNETRTDSELVALAAGGYNSAFGMLIDRHGAPVYDLCRRLLPEGQDPAAVAAEVFLLAAEHLWQLQPDDPFRPWILAIARHEVHQHVRRDRPNRGAQLETTASPLPLTDEIAPDTATRLLRDSSSVLDEKDRVAFEFAFAHSLGGKDLAESLGVRPDRVTARVASMRDHLATAVGSLVLARQGRLDCPQLDAIVGEWGGRFTPLLNHRISVHARKCATCDRTRAMVPPLVFSGTGFATHAPVALVPVPERLRRTVLESFDDRAGLAGDDPDRRHEFRSFASSRPSVVAPLVTAAVAALAVVGIVGIVAWASDDESEVRIEAAPSTRGDGPPRTAPVARPSVRQAPVTVGIVAETAPATETTVATPDTTDPGPSPSTTVRAEVKGISEIRLPGAILPGFFLTGPAATPSLEPPPTTAPPATTPPTTRPAPPTTRPPAPTTTRPPTTTTTTAPPPTTTTTTTAPPPTTTTTAPPPTTTTEPPTTTTTLPAPAP